MNASTHHQTIVELIGSNLAVGDQIRFLVTSASMHPLIRIGDTVVAEMVAGNTIRYGDIIIIKRAGDFLTHRAISPLKDGWLTKGDNTAFTDQPAKFEDIIGRVKSVQKDTQTINMETSKWFYINPVIAKLGKLEARAFSLHRHFRLPFRIMIKLILKFA